jgi:hypothetical protein
MKITFLLMSLAFMAMSLASCSQVEDGTNEPNSLTCQMIKATEGDYNSCNAVILNVGECCVWHQDPERNYQNGIYSIGLCGEPKSSYVSDKVELKIRNNGGDGGMKSCNYCSAVSGQITYYQDYKIMTYSCVYK